MAVKVAKAVDFPGEATGDADRPAQQGRRPTSRRSPRTRPTWSSTSRPTRSRRPATTPTCSARWWSPRTASRSCTTSARARCGSTCRCPPRPTRPRPRPVAAAARRPPRRRRQAARAGWRSCGWRTSRAKNAASERDRNDGHAAATVTPADDRHLSEGLLRDEHARRPSIARGWPAACLLGLAGAAFSARRVPTSCRPAGRVLAPRPTAAADDARGLPRRRST